MNEVQAYLRSWYDGEVAGMISQKYGEPFSRSLRRFLSSETYRMLCDPDLEMFDFSPTGIFDMWECEQVTGDPRNSLYLRRDAC